jgi:hydroxyacylglutathione hydrolase
MARPIFHEVGDYQIQTITSGRWRQNGYIVHHLPSSQLLLIDPGGGENMLLEGIQQKGTNLSHILLTHAHYDHVGALKAVCSYFDLPFILHRADYRLLRQAPLYGISFEKREIQIPSHHQFLDSVTLEWHGDSIQVFHTPGHTHGSVCYHCGNIAFTGDTILHEMVVRTDLPGSDLDILSASITYLLEELHAETWLFPGHGDPWQVKEARVWWEQHCHNPPEYMEE